MELCSKVGRWTIRFDPDATRESYAKASAIDCDCTDCANFRAAGAAAFPEPFLHLLRQLGIDPAKPAELCHYGTSGESMPTQGWFHFVGQLVDGADAWQRVSETAHHLDAEPFPGMQSIGFTSRLSHVPEAFAGQPLVQLEFDTVVPWALTEAGA
jgi:hypothetical protein